MFLARMELMRLRSTKDPSLSHYNAHCTTLLFALELSPSSLRDLLSIVIALTLPYAITSHQEHVALIQFVDCDVRLLRYHVITLFFSLVLKISECPGEGERPTNSALHDESL